MQGSQTDSKLRDAFHEFLNHGISRREFIATLSSIGVGATAASQLATALAADDTRSVKLSNVTGGRINCETLKLWDVEYVFGNTGSYEAGFVDALVDFPDIHYVLGLQEGSVMAMADGYARITGRTAFVNVHAITGTANALGLIVNAWADNSPVVVTVGLSETTGDNLGVFTETRKLETIPELFTKLSFRCSGIGNLAESLRRSFRLASLHPSGPVFLGIPTDIWSGKIASTELVPAGRTVSMAQVFPDNRSIAQAADWLAAANNPLLISGAELPRWGGLAELVEIADLLGATVSGDTAASRSSMGFPSDHPLYLGTMRGPVQSDIPFDVVLLAGASRLSLARGEQPLIPLDAQIIELGIREEHLARNYPADLLIYADPQVTLQKLLVELQGRSLDAARIVARREAATALALTHRAGLQKELERVWDTDPIAPERLAAEVDRAIDQSAVVVTEGVTSDAPIWNYVRFDQPGGGRRHLISSGGSLGWGLGAGIGAKLGAPDEQVIVLLGDGGFQFGVQALWTASRRKLPLIIVIFNNRAYQANRWALARLDGRAAKTGHYIGVNLEDPDIDHVGIAKAYGLNGERVMRPQDLAGAFERALVAEREGRAYVLDVVVAKRGRGAESDWHEIVDPVAET